MKQYNVKKGIFFVLILLYVLSSVDLCPGPIDDLIVLLLGYAGNKKLQ